VGLSLRSRYIDQNDHDENRSRSSFFVINGFLKRLIRTGCTLVINGHAVAEVIGLCGMTVSAGVIH